LSDHDDVFILPSDHVTVTQMNHIIEVQHMKHRNTKANLLKLDKHHYVDLSTGEKKEFQHIENRQQSYNSLRQTFKKLRYLLNNNFTGKPNELHITLTYAENMTDPKRLYKDFDKFKKRFKRYYKESTFDYVCVVEPQERGAWHCHLLCRFNNIDKIYLKNEDVRKLWGNGFVKIQSLNGVDNIGAYLTAYLTDIELTDDMQLDTAMQVTKEERKVVEKEVNGQKKKFIKGGRLHMYPAGMNLFRRSRGCEYPERENMRYESIKKIVGSAKPHYQKSIKVECDDFENEISYLHYNMKRD
jgi:hypothetical protein